MSAEIYLLITLSVIIVVKGENCTPTYEYMHISGECRLCSICPIGHGINKTQIVNSSGCYSCFKCSEGFYQDMSCLSPCKSCDNCQNQNILKNCSHIENGVCGMCFPGYHFVNKSVGCEKNTDDDLRTNCEKSLSAGEIAAIIFGIILAIVIGIFIYFYRRKGLKADNEPNGELHENEALSKTSC